MTPHVGPRTAAGAVLLAATVLAGCGSGAGATAAPPARSAQPTTAAPTTAEPTVAPSPVTSAPSPSAPAVVPSSSASPSASATPSAPASTPATAKLKVGSKGAAVLALQKRLLALGYWIPAASGTYGQDTAYAVTALQKAAGISRDGVAGPRTTKALAAGVRPAVRSTSGHVIEVDLTKQLVKVVDGGKLTLVLDTSTASGNTYVQPSSGRTVTAVTPTGTYRISRQIDGWRTSDLGHLWRPKYFNGGIALHGYPSVPAYPASHGCVRLPMDAMNLLWSRDLAPIGTKVTVYRS